MNQTERVLHRAKTTALNQRQQTAVDRAVNDVMSGRCERVEIRRKGDGVNIRRVERTNSETV